MDKIKLYTLSLLLLCNTAHSFDASKPINVIVPFAVGGGVDQKFKHLQRWAATQDVRIIANYRSGAEGSIGMTEIANSPNNGQYIGLTIAAAIAHQRVRDPNKKITIITGISSNTYAFVTNAENKINSITTLEQLINNDSKVSVGFGSPAQKIVVDQYLKLSDVKTQPILVPYKGGGPAVQAVLGNHIDVIVVPLQIVKTHIDNGKLRLLALSDPVMEFPSAIVLSEKYSAWKDYDSYVIVAPDNLNRDALQYWSTLLKKYLEDPSTIKYLKDEYSIPLKFGPADAETSIANSMTAISTE